ncbi:Serine/threonine-protein phosphatase 2A regulatory subunit B'' subunit alpha [Gamsiella multidivaricata]|nr:Serine/threonine-protein phosphatase 2A regulatory subunit B'' subunit alpha [Gamsiella multidivaricata]
MTLADLRRSSFDKTLWKLENSDLNQTEDCFSYKHFYVIYCKFWELDQDHDLILDEQDLAGYSGGAISTKVIRRVMQGYGNETGMFMVPDQEPLLEQQQQQTLLIQQQHQQQQQMAQNQLAEASVVEISGGIKNPISSGILDAEAGMVTVDLNEEEHHVLKRSETMTLSTIDMSSVTTEEVPTTVATTVSSLVFETAPSSVSTLSASESITILPQRSIPPGPGSQCHPQNYRMTYKGFIWFLLAETDKQTTTSIEYWFRCMDLDGDGILTVFELEQLFQEQAARMAILGMESFGFRDAVCQMQDLVSPKEIGLVRLSDLKQCGQAGPFIDLFCNVVRWRSFEAHQHQIRMRQQQIAMQRAADAAWEEVATGEDLFDDEDGDEGDDDFDDEDLDDDDDDDEDMEGEDEETDDLEDAENEGSTGSGSESAEPDDEDLLARNSELSEESSLSNTRMSMDPSRVNTTSTTVSAVKTETGVVSCVGIGLGVVIMNDVAQGLSQSLEQWRGGDISERSTATVKTLKRKRAKERRRKRRRAMMKRALLEEQRKEKALLATIRESPWIVYVESEYDKLVTIERPQSRTGWEEGEEDDEEEEEEEEMDDEEEEVMDEEDMLLEEGHNPAAAQQLQLQLLQQQQQQHQIQQMQMQMQQHHYRHQYHHHHHHHQHHHQHVVLAQIEAGIVDGQLLVEMDQMQVKGIAGGSVNACGQTVSRLSFEFGQDFEQIPVDSVGNEQTMAAARVAAGTNSL